MSSHGFYPVEDLGESGISHGRDISPLPLGLVWENVQDLENVSPREVLCEETDFFPGVILGDDGDGGQVVWCACEEVVWECVYGGEVL